MPASWHIGRRPSFGVQLQASALGIVALRLPTTVWGAPGARGHCAACSSVVVFPRQVCHYLHVCMSGRPSSVDTFPSMCRKGARKLAALSAWSSQAQQQALARQKLLCYGVLHLVAELCAAGPAGRLVLQHAHLAPLALQLFCCAWGVTAPCAAHTPDPDAPGGQGLHKRPTAVCSTVIPAGVEGGRLPPRLSCIQDHQGRELALDTLLAALAHPACLLLLVRACVAAVGSSTFLHVWAFLGSSACMFVCECLRLAWWGGSLWRVHDCGARV